MKTNGEYERNKNKLRENVKTLMHHSVRMLRTSALSHVQAVSQRARANIKSLTSHHGVALVCRQIPSNSGAGC